MNRISKVKKRFIVAIALLFSLFGTSESYSEQPKNTMDNKGGFSSCYDKLKHSVEWKELSNLWKNLTTKPKSILNSNLEEIANKNIDALEKRNLLSIKSKAVLKKVFYQRINHIRQKNAQVTCYSMVADTVKMYESKEDLEKRYALIENLYKENKISSETFKISKNKILKDLEFLNDAEISTLTENQKKEIIELIVNLNR